MYNGRSEVQVNEERLVSTHRYMYVLFLSFIIDAKLSIWSGCYTSQVDGRACLACFAMKGYHSQAKYEWLLNATPMSETIPLLCSACTGIYTCRVTAAAQTLTGIFRIDRMYTHNNYSVIMFIVSMLETWDGIRAEYLKEKSIDIDQSGNNYYAT